MIQMTDNEIQRDQIYHVIFCLKINNIMLKIPNPIPINPKMLICKLNTETNKLSTSEFYFSHYRK